MLRERERDQCSTNFEPEGNRSCVGLMYCSSGSWPSSWTGGDQCVPVAQEAVLVQRDAAEPPGHGWDIGHGVPEGSSLFSLKYILPLYLQSSYVCIPEMHFLSYNGMILAPLAIPQEGDKSRWTCSLMQRHPGESNQH